MQSNGVEGICCYDSMFFDQGIKNEIIQCANDEEIEKDYVHDPTSA